MKKETVSGSGISWAICKSAPSSRQITMPAPHHSVFYRPDALPAANQQCESTEGQGQGYKLYRKSTCSRVRSNFFSERVINPWNDMPADAVDFTSLANFKKSIMRVDC